MGYGTWGRVDSKTWTWGRLEVGLEDVGRKDVGTWRYKNVGT